MADELTLFDPQRQLQEMKQRYDLMVRLQSDNLMKKGIDYGIVPGTKKPTLLKPGAEKLCSTFGLAPVFEIVHSVENWDDDSPLFHYHYQCKLYDITGRLIATGEGSCNSKEKKYRFRKDYKTGQMVENDDIFSIVNTISKMAQKRALVAAVLIGCNASEWFTQDVEDMREFGSMDVIDGDFEEVTPEPPAKSKFGSPPKSNSSKTDWTDSQVRQNLWKIANTRWGMNKEAVLTALGIEAIEGYPANFNEVIETLTAFAQSEHESGDSAPGASRTMIDGEEIPF